jgi:hypothetical protein
VVPPLVNFSGVLSDVNGKPLSGVVGVTFAFYKDSQGGAPLWLETQNVYPDKSGRYTVTLGSSKSSGIPSELFAAGEARWLGVQAQGQAEQSRVLLLSVPYALKASDAETLGGKPASAYALATPVVAPASSVLRARSESMFNENLFGNSWGFPNFVAKFMDGFGDLRNSQIYDTGASIGIGTMTPAAKLEVNGTAKFDGLASFASGQTFPGTATLGVNAFTGNQTVNGNLSATGLVTGTAFNIGTNLFGWGSAANYNAFVGYAGNTAMTGANNTGNGWQALSSNTTGAENTANGFGALRVNTTGGANVANGYEALYYNTGGGANTATGWEALYSNTTGSYNTATGYQTLISNSTGVYNTASGTWALVLNTTGNYNTGSGTSALYFNTTGSANTASGYEALFSNTTGSYNTANGYQALYKTTGSNSTATGYQALYSSTTGYYNTANGFQALYGATTGSYNTAIGYAAIPNSSNTWSNVAVGYHGLLNTTTGDLNTAVGTEALALDVSGSNNVALGFDALYNNTGSNNIGIGLYGGVSLTTGNYNIDIGNSGVAGESYVTRIGTEGTQAAAYIAGIYNNNTGGNYVYVNSSGQLSSLSSSRRFKQDIRDMGDTTNAVMGLRPVRFRYKSQGAKGPEQYGLIAEEVQKVAPDLVGRGQDGQIDSVRYDKVNILLLNEVQKQHRAIEAMKQQLHAQINKQQQQIRAQQVQLKIQQAQIALLSSQVKAIQASLKINDRTGSEVRTAKAQLPIMQH